MSQKLRFWPKMAIFSHVRPNLGKMRIFLKKRALLFFYPYCPPTSCQVSGKSLERFLRSIRDGRTHGRTEKGEIIEPVASLVQNGRKKSFSEIFPNYFFHSFSKKLIFSPLKKIVTVNTGILTASIF